MNTAARTYQIFLLFLLLLIGAVHVYGLLNFLYWKIWWLDIPMHLIGGLWVGLAACYLFFLQNSKTGALLKEILITAVLAVLVIGIGWEIFEWSVDRFLTGRPFDIIDTSADLINDLIGSIAAVFLFRANYINQDNRNS